MISYILKFKFIQDLSKTSADYIFNKIKDNPDVLNNLRKLMESVRKSKISEEDCTKDNYKEVFNYGFQVVYGALIKILLLMGISLLLGTFVSTMVVTGSFAILRVFAGGLHFKSYTKCAYFSLTSLLLGGILAKYIPYNIIFSLIVTLFAFIIFKLYAPVENENRPIRDDEKNRFKLTSISILSVLFIAQSILFCYDLLNNINQSITFGVLLASVIATPYINKLE